MFIFNHKRWMENAINKDQIVTYVAVNTEREKEILCQYNKSLNIKVCGNLLGVCKPIYELSKDLVFNDNQIIIVVCDDVNCIPSWDVYFDSLFKMYKNSLLLINDGLQDPNNVNNPAVTMPVMDSEGLKSLNNIIFHPEYMHYFCDNELYYNAREIGILIDLRKESEVFQHEHYDIVLRPIDDVDGEIISKCGFHDREVYDRRMKLSIGERLKV
jgi:hypothetical protein